MNFEALVKHISTIQNTLQAQAAHAVNLALTSRNWLMGCYIVEFEQNGEERATYGEQLLKKLEQRLNTKGLNERRFREFRRLYLVYPQLREEILQYIMTGNEIRHTLSAEFTEPIRHSMCAELQASELQHNKWSIPAERLFNKLPYSHLKFISKIENPTSVLSMKWKQYVAVGLQENWNGKYHLCIMNVVDSPKTKKPSPL